MANATATQANGVCYIQTPATLSSMILIPKTSGSAQWINYCSWSDDDQPASQLLGEWSAQMQNINIISNPDSLINATTKHGTISKTTDPVVTGMQKTSLTFTHQVSDSNPIVADDLKITVINVTDDLTIITILAEDTGDQNYLDFNMTLIITDN